MPQNSCLLLRGRNYLYGFLDSDVIHVYSEREWRSRVDSVEARRENEGPLDVRRLGIDSEPELEPVRVLAVSDGSEVVPLLVRGAISTRFFDAEEVVQLPAGPWATDSGSRTPFCRVLLDDDKPIAVLLQPSVLREQLTNSSRGADTALGGAAGKDP